MESVAMVIRWWLRRDIIYKFELYIGYSTKIIFANIFFNSSIHWVDMSDTSEPAAWLNRHYSHLMRRHLPGNRAYVSTPTQLVQTNRDYSKLQKITIEKNMVITVTRPVIAAQDSVTTGSHWADTELEITVFTPLARSQLSHCPGSCFLSTHIRSY